MNSLHRFTICAHTTLHLLLKNPVGPATNMLYHTGNNAPEDEAIISTDEILLAQKPTRRRRSVRIAESENLYYASNTESVNRDLWYTLADFCAFQDDARITATRLQSTHDPESWSHSMMRVYFSLRMSTNTGEVKRVLQQAKVSLNETTLGLQDRCLAPICSDFLMRRQHLLQHEPHGLKGRRGNGHDDPEFGKGRGHAP